MTESTANDKVLKIGRFELVFPADHKLDVYQQTYKLYDQILGQVARLVGAKYPDATAIDVGANIGDSAALICRHRDMPVLCIEGHPRYAAYLRNNLARLPAGIEIAECLLGPAPGMVPRGSLIEGGGTATLKRSAATAGVGEELPVRLLSDVLHDHPQFAKPRLIKLDTDGADFEILISSMDVIGESRPVLYFEYSLAERQDTLKTSIAAISRLAAAGYNIFLVYDNFGNLMQVVSGDAANRFMDLNRYVMSQLLFGPSIHYLDVCAFAAGDEDLAQGLYRYQCGLVEEYARRAGYQV